MFWVTWSQDPGRLRLVLAAGLALVVLAVAGAAKDSSLSTRLLAPLLRIFASPAAVLLSVALALLPHLMVALKTPDSSQKPDVVFVLLDTVRLDHMGWGGCELDTSPRFDALAREGAAFSQTIAQAPWTKPAVATLMTSQVPGVHGATARRNAMGPRNRTLAEALAVAGYRTAAYSSNPNIIDLFGFEQGFQEFTAEVSSNAESFLERAAVWMDDDSDQASFLYLHLNDAHYPYDPLPGYAGLFNHTGIEAHLDGDTEKDFRENLGAGFTQEQVESMRLSFAEEIRYLDDKVGAFLEELLAENDNLLVVICSDHGEEFLEHGDLGHGHSLHEELIRVPLQFSWSPALGERLGLKPGIHDEQVRQLDVLPTLLELTDIAWPEAGRAMQGESLAPFLRGEDHGGSRLAFSETDYMGSPLSGPAGPLRSLRTPKEKLILTDPWFEPSAGRTWFYDLIGDPGEQRNLALEKPERLQDLWRQLQDLGHMVERDYETVAVEVSASQEAALRETGYADDGGGEGDFDAEPYFDKHAVPWAEVVLGQD